MDGKRASALFLTEVLPQAGSAAWQATVRVADGIAYLPWPDRAKAIDQFCWEQARGTLAHEHVTGVINRQADVQGGAVDAYARFCGSVVGAVLIAINERRPVEDIHHALIRLVSARPEDGDLARDWLEPQPTRVLHEALATLPGLAFCLLTTSSTDSLISFTARDAFWAAMLGQG